MEFLRVLQNILREFEVVKMAEHSFQEPMPNSP